MSLQRRRKKNKNKQITQHSRKGVGGRGDARSHATWGWRGGSERAPRVQTPRCATIAFERQVAACWCRSRLVLRHVRRCRYHNVLEGLHRHLSVINPTNSAGFVTGWLWEPPARRELGEIRRVGYNGHKIRVGIARGCLPRPRQAVAQRWRQRLRRRGSDTTSCKRKHRRFH